MAITQDQVRSFITANANNPRAIGDAMIQNRLSLQDVQRLGGYSNDQMANYIRGNSDVFSHAGDYLTSIGMQNKGGPTQSVDEWLGSGGQMPQPTGAAGGAPSYPAAMPTAGGPPPARPANPYMPNPTNSPMQPMAGAPAGMPSGMPAGQSFSQNPYTSMMAGELSRQVGRFTGDRLAGIRRGAIMAGGLGGSRQGVAEGTAIGEAAGNLGGQLAGLYSGQYNQDRGYGLQSDALDANIYDMNQRWMRTGQQDQLGLMDRMLGWQQAGINAGTQVQNTPFNYWQGFTGPATQMAGLGGTQSQNMQGNPWLSGLGGAVTGMNLYNQFNKPQG